MNRRTPILRRLIQDASETTEPKILCICVEVSLIGRRSTPSGNSAPVTALFSNSTPVVYVVFDLLWDNGRDLTGKSVVHRRKRLEEIIDPVAGIQVGGYLENRGIDLFRLAKEKGLEGIIAKRKTSIYRPGKRASDWLKIKSRPQQEFIVCGFTEGKGSRKHLGALLLARTETGDSATSVIREPDSRKAIGRSGRSD